MIVYVAKPFGLNRGLVVFVIKRQQMFKPFEVSSLFGNTTHPNPLV